jgi:hypothetical protein
MKSKILVLVLLSLAVARYGRAEIDLWKEFKIDFTSADDTAAKATWSDPRRITVTKDGLGWDGDHLAEFDGWMQTKALALGYSWRPTYAVNVRVEIQPPPQPVKVNRQNTFSPDAGDVYVRYSPDRVHWSNWQVLQRDDATADNDQEKTPRRYHGEIRVSYRDRADYSKLLAEYSKLDAPWKSDEEATVKWILDREADFFSKHLPFIGYIEMMYDGEFRGGRRIQSLKADISYGMGGLHSPPKDPATSANRDAPWRFVGKETEKGEPAEPAAKETPRR